MYHVNSRILFADLYLELLERVLVICVVAQLRATFKEAIRLYFAAENFETAS